MSLTEAEAERGSREKEKEVASTGPLHYQRERAEVTREGRLAEVTSEQGAKRAEWAPPSQRRLRGAGPGPGFRPEVTQPFQRQSESFRPLLACRSVP